MTGSRDFLSRLKSELDAVDHGFGAFTKFELQSLDHHAVGLTLDQVDKTQRGEFRRFRVGLQRLVL
jgi:hypothetical protein